jgi:hypothetical protein
MELSRHIVESGGAQGVRINKEILWWFGVQLHDGIICY